MHQPGDPAEVDFPEVLVDVAGMRDKAWLFPLRFMSWGARSRELTSDSTKSAFSTGTCAPLRFGGIPGRLAYDDLGPRSHQFSSSSSAPFYRVVCGAHLADYLQKTESLQSVE